MAHVVPEALFVEKIPFATRSHSNPQNVSRAEKTNVSGRKSRKSHLTCEPYPEFQKLNYAGCSKYSMRCAPFSHDLNHSRTHIVEETPRRQQLRRMSLTGCWNEDKDGRDEGDLRNETTHNVVYYVMQDAMRRWLGKGALVEGRK